LDWIYLSRSERKQLRRIVRRYACPYRVVVRAKLILQLYKDPCIAEAARKVGLSKSTVRRWRDRFLTEGRIKALQDQPRSGRPVEIDAVSRCNVIAMACGEPGSFGAKYRDVWTVDAIHASFVALHPTKQMSRTSVLRILNQEGLRPHRVKMWLHSPDPKFREKVTDICEVYLNPPVGAVVLCVDEKTGMQALGRKHPVKGLAPDRDRRIDYEYVRNGTRKLLAAFDPHTGEVYGEVRERRTAADLVDFMEALADIYTGHQVHIVWDNLNIHHDGPDKRWTKFNARHGGRFQFHYTPIHASWVNQVELFFGILQRRVLRYGVFDSLDALDDAVIGFLDHWNAHERHPFNWTFKGYRSRSRRRAA
jgi:transposase